jgi:hypothetical protein
MMGRRINMDKETPDVNSMAYHAQTERLKRLILEAIKDVEIDPDAFDEDDIDLMLGYIENIFQQLVNMDETLKEESDEDRETLKTSFLLKAIIANASMVVIQKKKLNGEL